MSAYILFAYACDWKVVEFTPIRIDEKGRGESQAGCDGNAPIWAALRTELVCQIFASRASTLIYSPDDPLTANLDPVIVQPDFEWEIEHEDQGWLRTKREVTTFRAAHIEKNDYSRMRPIVFNQSFLLGYSEIAAIPIADMSRLQKFTKEIAATEYRKIPDTEEEYVYCVDDESCLVWMNPLVTDEATLQDIFGPLCSSYGFELCIELKDQRFFER
ncbi:MAG: hypothetical protein Tsb009_26260 [Planctomycetaceae bacterium]